MFRLGLGMAGCAKGNGWAGMGAHRHLLGEEVRAAVERLVGADDVAVLAAGLVGAALH